MTQEEYKEINDKYKIKIMPHDVDFSITKEEYEQNVKMALIMAMVAHKYRKKGEQEK